MSWSSTTPRSPGALRSGLLLLGLLALWSSVIAPADAVAVATAVLAALAVVLAARAIGAAPAARSRIPAVPARTRARRAAAIRLLNPDSAGRPRPRAPGALHAA